MLLLVVLTGLILLGRGSGVQASSPAPPECLRRWNADAAALAAGSHNFRAHRYQQAEVLYLDDAGEPSRRGACAVVFASQTLDPERWAAARIYRQPRWLPLSSASDVTELRISELQVEAISGANATLAPGGELTPLP